MEELKVIFRNEKSFYKKANVEIVKNSCEMVKNLWSYSTLVASYILNFETMQEKFIYKGFYSQTTTRHQKEFFYQMGLNDEEIKTLFKKGELVKSI